MRLPALALLLVLLAAGCVNAPSSLVDDASTEDAAATAASTLPDPTRHEWSGFVLSSDIEEPTHFRPTEDAMWPVMQEGILFSVDKVPQVMEVDLSWGGSGEFMIMLHSHKSHGTNVYVEHITEMDDVNPKCLRVPTEDLAEGVWQVMIHSRGAVQVPFTLGVNLVGGEGHIVEDDRHGHWPQDGAFEVDPRPIEPCGASGASG